MKRLMIGTAAGLLLAATTATAASAAPPRPGCGYGDPNHSHQAAPGLDPMNLRPGAGTGDENHPHTFPPGITDIDATTPEDSPRRGCPA